MSYPSMEDIMVKMIELGRMALVLAAALVVSAGIAVADEMPAGDPQSVAYSEDLWNVLEMANLVGAGMINTTPYEGTEPHGAILETLDTQVTVGGHTGLVVVKRNYGPKGISTDDVVNDPQKYLAAVTVMFQREKGYDSDNYDWFWAKYKPDGSLFTNPKGVKLAGRIMKGADKGCIACHKGAGEDMLFNRDR